MPINRVLAASFPDDRSARAARAELLNTLRIADAEISVEALASTGERHAAVLAGRFEEDAVAAARTVVERFGGTLVIDVAEGGANA